jgi:cell division protein FtsW
VNKSYFEKSILIPVAVLIVIGLIMVFSSSGIYANAKYGNEYYFIKRQFLFVGVGGLIIFLISYIPVQFFYITRYFWLVLCLLLVALTLTPLGKKAGGASRWLSFMGFSLQPMEFVKVFLIIYFSWFFGEKQEKIKRFTIGFIPPILVTGIFSVLLIMQPDFGGAVFICSIFFFMSLIGGTRFLFWISSLMLFLGSAVAMVLASPYRLKRWKAFLHPFQHAKDLSYQIVQSIYGLAHGGIKGVGIGFGKQKLFYLPEAHTDFIVSVIGEEMGFLGISLIFLSILWFLFSGMKLALLCKDLKDKFLISGITFMVVFAAELNIAVVFGMLPPKGLPMPFISYGGSSLVALCFGIGLIFSVLRKNFR